MVITCGNPSKGHLVQHLPLPVTVTWHTHVFVLKVVERTCDNLHVMATTNQLARVTVVARTSWFSWRKCVVVNEPDIHSFCTTLVCLRPQMNHHLTRITSKASANSVLICSPRTLANP